MVGEIAVDVGECFQVTLRVRGRGSGGCCCGFSKIAHSGAEDFHRPVGPFQKEGVWLALMPLQATGFAVDADVQVVLLAHGNLGGVQDSLRTALEAEEHIGVEEASLDKGRDVGREFFDAQTGDVFGQIFGMGADVTDASGGAGALSKADLAAGK